MSRRLEGMALGEQRRGRDPGGKAQYVGLTVKNARGRYHFNGTVRCVHENLTIPIERWKSGRMIFVDSMSDLFHPSVPFNYIDKVFGVMALCPQHRFQVLTKRPERAAEWAQHRGDAGDTTYMRVGQEAHWIAHPDAVIKPQLAAQNMRMPWPLPNVAVGTSIELQKHIGRLSHLARVPAAVRFLSLEPLLGAITLPSLDGRTAWCPVCGDFVPCTLENWHSHNTEDQLDPDLSCKALGEMIHWVIVGGESGHGARPMHLNWVRSLRDQCEVAGIRFHFKQKGVWSDEPRSPTQKSKGWVCECGFQGRDSSGTALPYEPHECPGNRQKLYRVGKGTAGRLLDGVVYDEFPSAWDEWIKETSLGKSKR